MARPPEAGAARRGPGRRGSGAGGAAGSGEASLGRGRGRSGAARGLRAAGGGLARGGGSRSPAPRLSEDAATSGGGPRRPGMAAWSPAAAAPLLRGIRGVSAGGTGLLFPGGSCGGTAGPAAARGRAPGERGAGPGGLPFLSLIHSSLVGFFSGPGRRASEKRRAPARAGGAPEPVEVGDEGDRHRNSHDPAGAEKAVLMYCAGDMAVTARRPGAGECEGSGLWALGKSSHLCDRNPLRAPHALRRSPAEGTHHALSEFSLLAPDSSFPHFIHSARLPVFFPSCRS